MYSQLQVDLMRRAWCNGKLRLIEKKLTKL